MNQGEWTDADAAQAAIAGYGPTEPLFMSMVFLSGLHDPSTESVVLLNAVTPESGESWGDFGGARKILEQIGDWGVASYPMPAPGAPDVAYIKILRQVTETYMQRADAEVALPAVVTVVWRPEAGAWLVHAIGPPLPADLVPRSSPGVAPPYTTA